MGRLSRLLGFAVSGGLIIFSFQNCSDVKFTDSLSKLGSLGVCNNISCDLTPLTEKPAVTTILIAMGDEHDSQLVVAGASSQLIAETVVRYSSPKQNPRILMVRDSAAGAEDPEDTAYVVNVLLARYDVQSLQEPPEGLTDADLAGYDLVWFNNPGAPMGKESTRDVLIRFSGGVVIQGDDLSRGNGFTNEALTGLRYIDNGTSVECDGTVYPHDNNGGHQFRLTLDSNKIPGANSSTIKFQYGNDIDMTEVVRPGLEILALAQGGPSECTGVRPAIVRYTKN